MLKKITTVLLLYISGLSDLCGKMYELIGLFIYYKSFFPCHLLFNIFMQFVLNYMIIWISPDYFNL